MSQVITIGLDIAKSVFQLHGVDAGGAVLLRKRLPRSRMLAFFEKPYVKRQKNDAADAEAICEAVTRPSMRFVPIKAPEQQSMMVAHRARSILTRQRTQLSNAIRGHMTEFGLVAPVGRNGLEMLISVIDDVADERVPTVARTCLLMLVTQLRLVNAQILESDRCIIASARSTEVGRRLMGIPGVGPVLASALVATIADPKSFSSGRNLAAWIGLVPRQRDARRKLLRSRSRTRTPEWCGRS